MMPPVCRTSGTPRRRNTASHRWFRARHTCRPSPRDFSPRSRCACAATNPSTITRAKLLGGLAEKGFGGDQLAEMQKIIDAEKSDLFDVLAHVASALPPLTRDQRAVQARGA